MPLKYKILILVSLIVFKTFAQTPALQLPGFTFYKPDKSVFTEKNVEPNKMLFFFFFDTDCEHCQRAMKYINQHYEEYKKTSIYLISIDDKEKINQFMSTYGSNLNRKKNVTLLEDPKNEFIVKFTPRKYPAMFLYSADKKLTDYEDNDESVFRFSRLLNTAVKVDSKK
jgi:peroxiredoxin